MSVQSIGPENSASMCLKLSGTPCSCLWARHPRRLLRWSRSSRELVRNSLRSSGPKGYSDTSIIEDRWRPTLD